MTFRNVFDARAIPLLMASSKLFVEVARKHHEVEGKTVQLSPGMSITAEIKTGQRRLIEFFLSPLLRYRQESVRER